MVLRRILANEKINDKLGEEGVQEILASMWPGDCQTCNRPLGDEPPALLVNDMIAFGTATLHHPSCQAPDWNDGSLHARPPGDFVSWRARVVMLPIFHGSTPDPRPMLLVNPGLEMVMLHQDDQKRWRVTAHSAFTAMGLRPPGDQLLLDRPLPNITGHSTSTTLSVRFQAIAPNDGYDAPAGAEYRQRARELGGFLLGITHALDPNTLTAENVQQTMVTSRIIMGWIALT
ncbi:hypothetical protein [Streptosporangium sp. NPDC023615]|uniref:hypothetical protein n=1 Tax=Streptosporangium sp. NPDC023615 TaxID=3154794 RepID=UPI00342A4DDC